MRPTGNSLNTDGRDIRVTEHRNIQTSNIGYLANVTVDLQDIAINCHRTVLSVTNRVLSRISENLLPDGIVETDRFHIIHLFFDRSDLITNGFRLRNQLVNSLSLCFHVVRFRFTSDDLWHQVQKVKAQCARQHRQQQR